MTKLESSFKPLREKASITTNWGLLLDACGLDMSETTNNILNHVLQHFWTSIVLAECHDLNDEHESFTKLSDSLSSNPHDEESDVNSIEGKTVQEHAGWVFKRVMDFINTGPQVHKIQVSKTNATEIEVNKNHLQSLIAKLGKDNLVQPGKFLFIPEASVVEVFIYLHEIVEKIVKDGLKTCVDKDILKKCLQYLSEDKDLRQMWHKLLGDEDTDIFCAASVVLLQRVVVMFVKSKQQTIQEQLQLKASKQSAPLRQTVELRQKPKEKKEPPSQSINHCIS